MGGNRVLEACRMVVGIMKNAYEMSEGDQKKGEVPAPTWGAGTSPWKDYVRNNLPVLGWLGELASCG